MSVSNPPEPPTPRSLSDDQLILKASQELLYGNNPGSSLREQIAKQMASAKWSEPGGIADTEALDNIMSLVDYEHRVADNVRLVANSTGPTTWLDPQTGAKVYNQAYIDKLANSKEQDRQGWKKKGTTPGDSYRVGI